jgi:copper chaperone CopZ
MKTISFITALLFSFFITTPANAQKELKKETIKVWGNCGMCKKLIEKSAKSAGAKTAVWNDETQELAVSYATEKTTLEKIQQAIAKAGYDTQDFTADDKAYRKLPACCHYERKVTDKPVSEIPHQ